MWRLRDFIELFGLMAYVTLMLATLAGVITMLVFVTTGVSLIETFGF